MRRLILILCFVLSGASLLARNPDRLWQTLGEFKQGHSSCEAVAGLHGAVVIVNPFSSGKLYVPAARALGLPILGLFTSREFTEFFTHGFDPSIFDGVILYEENDEDALVDYFKNTLEVKAVLAGVDRGVAPAARLAERLGLRGNTEAVAKNFWNKFEQQEALRRAGLKAAEQIRSPQLQPLLDWSADYAKAHPERAPKDAEFLLYLKPENGAAGSGGGPCLTRDDICRIYTKAAGKENATGAVSEFMNLQEYFRGKEFIVESISIAGEHHFLWATEYEAEPGLFKSYYAAKLLPSRHPAVEYLQNFVRKALTAIGMQWGPMHTELKILFDGDEPVIEVIFRKEKAGEPIVVGLVEFNGRMAGVQFPRLVKAATGIDEARLALLAMIDPERAKVEIAAALAQAEKISRPMTLAMLRSPIAGYLRSYEEIEAILRHPKTGLATLNEIMPYKDGGSEIAGAGATLEDIIFAAVFIDEDPQAVERDVHALLRRASEFIRPDAPVPQ